MDVVKKKVAVIGAGPAGLAAVKTALDYELEPICFELKNDIGGLWNAEWPAKTEAQVYAELTMNSGKFHFEYSDFPHNKSTPLLMEHSYTRQYLNDYADHFGLKKFITLGRRVTKVRRAEDHTATGRWIIQTVNAETGETFDPITVDAVIVCSGPHGKAIIPKLPGMNTFKGVITHGGTIESIQQLCQGKRILVSGSGVTGMDVAMHASHFAEQVYYPIPYGAWYMPHLHQGRHFDWSAHSWKMNTSDISIDGARRVLEKICRANSDHKALNIEPEQRMLFRKGGNFAMAAGFDIAVHSGKLKAIKADVKSFDKGSVTLSNGESFKVDVVIFAHGYTANLPFLEETGFDCKTVLEESYMFACPIEQQHHTLFCVGMPVFFQAVLPAVELMSRLACGIISGAISVSKEEMWRWLEVNRKIQINWSGEYPGKVMPYPWRFDISKVIGCYPDLAEIARRDKHFAELCTNGPVLPAHFRLLGTHANWEVAAESIRYAHSYYSKGEDDPPYPWDYHHPC